MINNKTSGFLGGNYRWTVRIGENRNENHFRIYDQSMGESIFESNEVWDTDALKLIRLLLKYEFVHGIDINEAIKLANKELRHIKLYGLKNKFGAVEQIIDLGDG